MERQENLTGKWRMARPTPCPMHMYCEPDTQARVSPKPCLRVGLKTHTLPARPVCDLGSQIPYAEPSRSLTCQPRRSRLAISAAAMTVTDKQDVVASPYLSLPICNFF